MLNKPSIVEHNNYRFMIFSAPDNNSLSYWIDQFKLYKVTDIVRTCERTYNDDEIIKEGIRIHELRFDDGKFPSLDIIKSFLNIVNEVFKVDRDGESNSEEKCIAIHCIAGLGRAPVLVAIALIEIGMEKVNAIQLIRMKRKGAINMQQYTSFMKYKKIGFKNKKETCCIIF